MMTDSQKTAIAAQKTAVAPQKTAVAPRKAAVTSQSPAIIQPPKITTPGPFHSGSRAVSSGAEADIVTVERQGRKYALKQYHEGFHPNTRVNEALKHLGGRGVVADIFETGTTPDGREYELMEYIPGGSLARYDLRGNAAAITTIVLRVAMALDACHRSRIIHKDIKPANILVRDMAVWDCVLCDFGIADMMNSDGKSITRQSRTPIYAAPEIYDPARAKARIDGADLFEISPATDFYSLGMTALCLWSGEQAFLAAEDQMAVWKLKGGMALPQNMPERLRDIIAGLLRKNPSERWTLKDIENRLGGHWAVMHTLNPLSDVKLDKDPQGKGYAMTGETIGAFLNKVYMWQFADAKAPADTKVCQAIVDSFSDYEGSYMQLFFESKGDRFTDQDSWMEYCCDWDSEDNAGKAGPQDEDTRLEISMMKTIKGFGFDPYYEFEDDTVISLDELGQIDVYDRKFGLTHGLKGWLAVQFHEDPYADLSEEYAYETLLEEYILAIEEIDPDSAECGYYRYACDKADEMEKEINRTQRKNRGGTIAQTILDIVLVVLPLVFVTVWTLCSLNAEPKIIYWPILAAVVFQVVANVRQVLFKRYSYTITHTAGGPRTDLTVSGLIKGRKADIGMEELVVEPLYYAFSDDNDFDSSLNGITRNRIWLGWGQFVKDRRKKLTVHIVRTLVIIVLACLILPGPGTVMHTDSHTETTEINEQVQ